MAEDTAPAGFLSRWSQRKAQLRQGLVPAEPAPPAAPAMAATPAPAVTPAPATAGMPAPPDVAAPEARPTQAAPTLADVARLTRDSDYSRFVAPGVDSGVKNAALKTLFTDPHFNVMDGLDTYIDDYGRPDPLPAGMLRQMAQSQFLGLFADEDAADNPPNPPPNPPPDPPPLAQTAPDEDPALRLQPHDAAGPGGPAEGPVPDPGRQC